MKFASIADGSLDGRLVVVSRDLTTMADATQIAPSLAEAVRRWDDVSGALQSISDALNGGTAAGAVVFDPHQCAAPLPRSPQWCDGSAFLNHGQLMDKAFDKTPMPDAATVPMMYQGASDDFLGPHDDVPMVDETEGIDFEGEFGVIVGPVPMAVRPDAALEAIRLVVQLNDWSLRGLASREMATGFGFLQAKPSTAFAPVAITADELGDAWKNGRVHLNVHIEYNGQRVGDPNGSEMNFHFGDLIAHAAHSRRLKAGTIVGSGTVSNVDRSAGSACLAEVRVIEIIDKGAATTPFMKFGDRVRMQAQYRDGSDGPFGVIEQGVVQAGR